MSFNNNAGDCLVFVDVVDRSEHLRRLGIIADVFLDTPAYLSIHWDVASFSRLCVFL